MIRVLLDVMGERQRQIAKGFDANHDDQYSRHPGSSELVLAALCYIDPTISGDSSTPSEAPFSWPWDAKWWRPEGPRRNLIKAAALLLAEIERLDRHEAAKAALERLTEENQKLGLYDDETPKNN